MAMFTPPHCTLSFCIPTYNRSVEVGALVRRVLQCPAADIEVLVLDNGSTDDTLKRLAQIDDPRLSIYSNGHNRGVLFNVVNVLLRGRGQGLGRPNADRVLSRLPAARSARLWIFGVWRR